MTMHNWPRLLASIPSGLTHTEVAQRLGTPYQQTRWAILKHGYQFSDGRRFSQNRIRKIMPEEADWSRSNIDLARDFGVSRERVRVLRERLGKPFVESRGRKSSVKVRMDRNGRSGRKSRRLRPSPVQRRSRCR